MTRYTSPGLSRQLAEAGLTQWVPVGCHWWNDVSRLDGLEDVAVYVSDVKVMGDSLRALDLTDVLSEIRRIAPTADLSVHTCDIGWACQMWPNGTSTWAGEVPAFEAAHPESIVEAAGLVLLALL